MNFDVKECRSLSKNVKKFAVLVNHNCVGESKVQPNLHKCWSKFRCVLFRCGFADAKRGHATCTNEVVLCTNKIHRSARSVNINKEDPYMCINRKDINKVCTTILCDFGKRTFKTSFTHLLALMVHARPEVSLANPMVGAVHIWVPANLIFMKGHEDYVS